MEDFFDKRNEDEQLAAIDGADKDTLSEYMETNRKKNRERN